ncbi:N-succinylglutamate 5-semialdehyde dehydrogenase [Escherichia coli]|nr:N-succinylglutamate 5-semialdehyde dehydrogenase [Escherichia coli]
MTLWINGDWITGQGASRVKRNPVSGECYGKAMMPMPLRSSRLVGQPVRRFRAGRGFHLLNVMPLSNALPHCWKAIKPN